MMAVPDSLLESRSCSVCHKFLSVYPIKEYPEENKIICGRCAHSKDGGILCKYSFFDLQGLFKCVNRFDGCRQMLRFPEIRNHEYKCPSKTYVCPVCPHRPAIPTFFVLIHFSKDHEDKVLKTNSFVVDLTTLETNTLLYRLKDNLFFIEYKRLAADSFALKALFLGIKGVDDLTQKFTVHLETGEKIVTGTKPMCIADDVGKSKGFVIRTATTAALPASGYATVHVDLGELEVVLAIKNLTKRTPMVTLPRRVLLLATPTLKFSSAEASVFVYVEDQSLEFAMYCVGCAGAARLQPAARFINSKPGKFQFVCEQCEYHVKQQFPTAALRPAAELYPGIEKLVLRFACVWCKSGCEKTEERVETLERHEIQCAFQVAQRCPVPSCTFVGMMIDLVAHFSMAHQTHVLNLHGRTIIVERCFSFVENIFIWAFHGFVWMQVVPSQATGVFTVGIRQRYALETFGQPQARLLVVEPISGRSALLKDEMNVGWYVNTKATSRYQTDG